MARVKTILEGGGNGSRRASDNTIAETPPPRGQREERGHDPRALMSVPEGYEVVRTLDTASGQADLWLVRRLNDQREFVLKLYHKDARPKLDVLEKWKKLNIEHVVELVDYGEIAGRFYEVLEFIPNGSLAEWLADGKLPEDTVREIMRELCSAVAELHRHKIIHRDIKPSNVLIRKRKPLDLAFTDFGISSIANGPLHFTETRSRTAKYAPPEATVGAINETYDWWSIGVIGLEMLTGGIPFVGIKEDQAISRTVLFHGIEVPETIADDWRMLLRGLLTRDPEKRWGEKQVTAWLAGKRDIPVFYESPVAAMGYKPFEFMGSKFLEPAKLAVAMAENWDEGAKYVRYLEAWLQKEVGSHDLAVQVGEIARDKKLDPGIRLTFVLLALYPDAPVAYRGDVITREWLAQHPETGVLFVSGSAPAWLRRLRKDEWLEELQRHWNEIRDQLKSYRAEYDDELASRLILTPAEQVLSMGAEEKNKYIRSTDREIHAILEKKGRPSEAESILLLSCSRSLMVTDEAVRSQEYERLCGQINNLIQQIEAVQSAQPGSDGQMTRQGRLSELNACLSQMDVLAQQSQVSSRAVAAHRSMIGAMRTGNRRSELRRLNKLNGRLKSAISFLRRKRVHTVRVARWLGWQEHLSQIFGRTQSETGRRTAASLIILAYFFILSTILILASAGIYPPIALAKYDEYLNLGLGISTFVVVFLYHQHSIESSRSGSNLAYGVALRFWYPIVVYGAWMLHDKSNETTQIIWVTLLGVVVTFRILTLSALWRYCMSMLFVQYRLVKYFCVGLALVYLARGAILWHGDKLQSVDIYVPLALTLFARLQGRSSLSHAEMEALGYGAPTTQIFSPLNWEIVGLLNNMSRYIAGLISMVLPSPRYDVRLGQLIVSVFIRVGVLYLCIGAIKGVLGAFGVKSVWVVQNLHVWCPLLLAVLLIRIWPQRFQTRVDNLLLQ